MESLNGKEFKNGKLWERRILVTKIASSDGEGETGGPESETGNPK